MSAIVEKAKKIRLAIFDVDGVLTSGKLHYGPNGTEFKSFHVQDGLGLKLLLQNQIEVAIITARESEIVSKRMKDLGITHVYQGHSNKYPAYLDLKQKLGLEDHEIAYTGDDLPDVALIRLAGLGMSVPNAPAFVREQADWISELRGGKGAVREICEMILSAQGSLSRTLNRYLEPEA